jgi:cytochrome c biogenesis protein CcmG, thiol:disulfide interchange protein DsbE
MWHPLGVRAALIALAAAGLVAVLVIGLTQAGSGNDNTEKLPRFNLQAARRVLATAPAPLSGLYAQANELLTGSTSAFTHRLAELKGRPLVINKWASWCGPCQAEFPIFQSVAAKQGTRVGFLGLDVNDTDSAAKRFLAKRPLPYPSYVDTAEHLTRSIDAPLKIAPVTIFLNRAGKTAYIHTGAYLSAADLSTDIRRYLH